MYCGTIYCYTPIILDIFFQKKKKLWTAALNMTLPTMVLAWYYRWEEKQMVLITLPLLKVNKKCPEAC